MSHNPYTPPKSNVDDAVPLQATHVRPTQVVLAIRLAALNYGLGLIAILVSWEYFSRLQSIGSLIFNQIFSLALSVWLYYKIYVGRNWARVTLLVFFALGSFMTLSSLVRDLLMSAPVMAKAQMVLGIGIGLTILWLLFFSPGRHWFRRTPGEDVP